MAAMPKEQVSDLESSIKIHHTTVAAPFPGAPAFTYQLTRLTDTLFIWVGAGEAGSLGDEETSSVGTRRLAGDWAVAMPSRGSIPATATPIFRSGATDTARPMAERLAKRFPPNQIHLSLSLPESLTASSGSNLDPYASKALLVMEKKLGAWLAEILANEATRDTSSAQ